MRTFGFVGVAAVALLALPLTAQVEGNQRVMRVFAGGRYQSPLCPLKGDFRTSSAGMYLKTSVEGAEGGARPDDEKRIGIVKKGRDQALEAVKANPKSGAGWYYLGRAELLLGNLVGADTAFTKATENAPDCAEEIKGYRQRAWQPLLTGAAEAMKASKNEEALTLFREAAIISRDYPQGFYNTGILFANTDKPDSAAHYFALAVEKSGNDPRLAKDKLSAIVNLASMYQAMDKHAEAVVQFRKFLAVEPNDAQVKKAMASSLRLSGQAEEASKIESAMLTSALADGSATANDLMQMGVNLFQDKKYPEAADAFGKALEKEPYFRDALFNLANVYLAEKNGPKLVETAQKLLAMEPLNTINMKLLGEGYRAANDQTKLIETVEKLVGVPTNVSIDNFQARKDGAKMVATATGLEATTPGGKPLPAVAKTLTFEFLDATGTVVATKEVAVPALKAGATHPIEFEVTGANIHGWRYTAK
ncbi:MAG: tetratricopeptide repeat protein [Gemmatimonadetes bacterium]|nr:tetratricopeptide repeat protein [Gemmatimonadota bacterium]MBP6572725.1 tetratricopeptide repeat protein [Gemmatimonadales bacterium]